MNKFHYSPIKLYIQDIYRATQSENQYIYEIFDLKFKNIMIHGVITAVYNKTEKSTVFELSDPTGSVQIYYDSTKCNNKISEDSIKDLLKCLGRKAQSRHDEAPTMSSLFNLIEKKYKTACDFENGSQVCVVGDIFKDEFKNTRMVCAFKCRLTSVERDIVWLEEIRYLYENYYLKAKEVLN